MSARAFRLASLLRLRQAEENEAAGGLARANAALDQARTIRAQSLTTLSLHALSDTDPQGFMAAVAARSALTSAYLDSIEDTEHAQRNVDVAHDAWREARLGARALEHLEDKHRENVAQADARAEQARLDELASRRREDLS